MYNTRKALKNLQYSPKGQDIAGINSKNILNQKENITKMKELSTPIMRRPQQKRLKEMSDEKENPSKRISIQTFNTIGIQCSKLDEEMLCGDVQTNNYYWKIMAYKRRIALNNVNEENKELHDMIEQLNHENELLREENKDLLELLDEANNIKELANDKNDGDSGYIVDTTQ